MRPLLLGHRGARASRRFPENTLASFNLCLQHGCDGFEFDVRRSSDDIAVINHDPEIRGRVIANTPANMLTLPTLEEVLSEFATRAFLDIELKEPGLEEQLLATLRKHVPQRGYVVSSFLPEVLTAIHALDPDVPLGQLYEKSGPPAAAFSIAWSIPHHKLVTEESEVRCHNSNAKLMTWTVNDAQEMRRLAAWGIDAIISDETELLVKTLR